MRFSFKSRQQHVPWTAVRALWQAGDELPIFSAAWLFDHFYPIFSDDTGPCFEGWTLLTALSQQTSRLRVGMMVFGNTYRHPAVVANMAATLDVICDGRLELGLGAGWNEREHGAYGIALPPVGERMDRLAEACEVIHLLLTEPSANFAGRHYGLTRARCEPKPVQRPRPPIVIGGRGERRTLRIAARWADQWNLPSGSPEEFAHKLSVLHRHMDDIGRDPDAVEPSVQIDASQSATDIATSVRSMAAAGARHVICNLPPDATPETLASLAARLDGLAE
jgi:F420-dependent oxidoreductase-like protein